jgi:hypothetical protein
MEDRIYDVLRDSLEIVTAKPAIPPEYLIWLSADQEGNEVIQTAATLMFAVMPCFYRTKTDNLEVYQHQFLGMFIVRTILMSFLAATTCLSAANYLLKEKYYAASIQQSYGSLFHTVRAYLAVCGRVRISWFSTDKSADDIAGNRDVMCIRTEKYDWVFELRDRSHIGNWRELEQVHGQDAFSTPKGLRELLRYCRYYGPYDKCVDASQELTSCINELVQARHSSIYNVNGYDSYALDTATNGEFPRGLYSGANTFLKGANEFLNELANEIMELKAKLPIELWNTALKDLALGLLFNPCELPMKRVKTGDPLVQDVVDELMLELVENAKRRA